MVMDGGNHVLALGFLKGGIDLKVRCTAMDTAWNLNGWKLKMKVWIMI